MHDSDCPLCRYAAQRMGYERWVVSRISEIPGGVCYVRYTKEGGGERRISFCASLEAVTPLMKEMCVHWHLFYDKHCRQWVYRNTMDGRSFNSPESLPAACVILAHKDVFGEERDDV